MTFLSVPEQSRGKVQKLAEYVMEIIPPWHFRDLNPSVFSIPVQAPKRKCHLFYLLGGIHQLNVTLRPGHDSSSLPLPCLLMSQQTHCVSLTHTHSLGMCSHRISDILNNADGWPCWGNLSHTGNLELVSAAFWTNCTDLWNRSMLEVKVVLITALSPNSARIGSTVFPCIITTLNLA